MHLEQAQDQRKNGNKMTTKMYALMKRSHDSNYLETERENVTVVRKVTRRTLYINNRNTPEFKPLLFAHDERWAVTNLSEYRKAKWRNLLTISR